VALFQENDCWCKTKKPSHGFPRRGTQQSISSWNEILLRFFIIQRTNQVKGCASQNSCLKSVAPRDVLEPPSISPKKVNTHTFMLCLVSVHFIYASFKFVPNLNISLPDTRRSPVLSKVGHFTIQNHWRKFSKAKRDLFKKLDRPIVNNRRSHGHWG